MPPEEGPAHGVPHGRDRLRSAAHRRPLLGRHLREPLRGAAHLRLPRAPGEARAARRRGDARARGERHALHLPHQAAASSSPTIPAFKGQKRELVAKDIEYAIKRFRDPKNRSPYEWLFENKIVGLDELAEQREEDRHASTTTRRSPASRCATSYTISFKLKEPDYNFLYVLAMPNVVPVAREVIEAYGDDTHGAPGRHRPLRAQGVGARARRSCSSGIPTIAATSSDTRYADPNDEWDRARDRGPARQAPAAARPRRDLSHRGRAAALPRVPQQGARHPRRDAVRVHQPGACPTASSRRRSRSRACTSSASEQPEITYYAFNMSPRPMGRPNPVGGYTPERVALRRAMVHRARSRTRRSTIIRKGQAIAAQTPGAAGHRRLRPQLPHRRAGVRRPARPRRCSTCSATSIATATAGASSPTARRSSIDYKYQAGSEEYRQLAELWVKALGGGRHPLRDAGRAVRGPAEGQEGRATT